MWQHGCEGVCRGGCALGVVAVSLCGLGAGAVPVNGDEGGRGVWRPGPRVGGAIVAGGIAEEGEGDGVVDQAARSGAVDATAGGADGLVRVRWIGRHRRKRKEKGGQINTASAVVVPSFGISGFIT